MLYLGFQEKEFLLPRGLKAGPLLSNRPNRVKGYLTINEILIYPSGTEISFLESQLSEIYFFFVLRILYHCGTRLYVKNCST